MKKEFTIQINEMNITLKEALSNWNTAYNCANHLGRTYINWEFDLLMKRCIRRQFPIKPNYDGDTWKCPACNNELVGGKYCSDCGQLLDLED